MMRHWSGDLDHIQECWFDFDDYLPGEGGHTCMLPKGHEGPHEPTPDREIVVAVVEEDE